MSKAKRYEYETAGNETAGKVTVKEVDEMFISANDTMFLLYKKCFPAKAELIEKDYWEFREIAQRVSSRETAQESLMDLIEAESPNNQWLKVIREIGQIAVEKDPKIAALVQKYGRKARKTMH